MGRILFPTLFLLFLTGGSTPSAFAEDWPHWRGANRDAITSERSGWKGESWIADIPLWQTNVGEGASSPIVSEGHAYTFGWSKENDFVRCLDAQTGELVWEQSYPSPSYGRRAVGDQKMYGGATANPELDPSARG